MDIEKLINKVTTQTVVKLKKSNLMKDNTQTAFKRTEELLRNYTKYIAATVVDPEGTVKTQKIVRIIDSALKSIESDQYFGIIEMFYFEHQTREEIAEFFDVEVKTITRNKSRLINELKLIIFSDKTIEEIFM